MEEKNNIINNTGEQTPNPVETGKETEIFQVANSAPPTNINNATEENISPITTNIEQPSSSPINEQNNPFAPNPGEPIEPVTPPKDPNTIEQLVESDKKPKKKKIILLLLILILIVACVIGYFMFYKPFAPNLVIDRYVQDGKGYIEDYFTQNKNEVNLLEDDITSSTTVTFNTTNQEMSLLNNITLKVDASETTKNEFAKANISLKQGTANLDFNAFIKEKNAVLEIVGINNGLMSTVTEENIFDNIKEYANNSFSKSDIKYISEKYIEYLGESLKEANITEKNTLTEVKYNVVIDKSTKEKINKKFNELVKNDEKLSKLYKEDYKLFNDYSYGSNEEDDSIKLSLTLNRFNKKINYFSYKKLSTELTGNRTAPDTFEITSNEEKTKIVIKEKENARDFIVYDKENKEISNGSIEWTKDSLNLKFNDKESKGNYTFDYKKLNESNSQINATYKKEKTTVTVNLKLESDENKMNNTGNVKINSDNNDYTIGILQTINFGKDLVNVEELKQAKDINSFTEEESSKLQTDLMNKLNTFDFMKYFNGMFQDAYSDTNYGA